MIKTFLLLLVILYVDPQVSGQSPKDKQGHIPPAIDEHSHVPGCVVNPPNGGGGNLQRGGLGGYILVDSDTKIAMPINDFSMLILSIVLLSISFFLLFQSIAFLIWASRGDDKTPPPKAGLGFAWLSLVMVFLFWIPYIGFANSIDPKNYNQLLIIFLYEPRLLIPPIIIGSIVPSILALYKFAIANSFARANVKTDTNYARPPLVALVGVAFTMLQLSASIVTLIMFWNSK